MSKKLISIILTMVLVLSVVLVSCAKEEAPTPVTPTPVTPTPVKPTPTPTPEPITIRVTCHNPETGPAEQGTKWFGDKVTELTEGRVEFEYFWGGSLAKAGEGYVAIEKGIADMGMTGYMYHPPEFPLATFFYATVFGPSDPMMYHDAAVELYAQVPAFHDELARYNQKFLFPALTDNYEINTIEPAPTLADLKGRKIGTVGSEMPKWTEALGAVAVQTPMMERFSALQTGVLDGQLLPLNYIYSMKFHEIAPNLTIGILGCAIFAAVAMNLDTWNSLPADIQEIMMEQVVAAGQWQAELYREMRETSIAGMKDEGTSVYYLSDEDRLAWAEAMSDIPAEWAVKMEDQGLPGWQVWDTFEKITREQGHQWIRDFGVK